MYNLELPEAEENKCSSDSGPMLCLVGRYDCLQSRGLTVIGNCCDDQRLLHHVCRGEAVV